jgi:histone H3/H4
MTVKNIIQKYTDMSISEDAIEVFAEVTEEYMKELTVAAATFARHAERKTLRQEDVLLAKEVTRKK